jgi:hypothetical protein
MLEASHPAPSWTAGAVGRMISRLHLNQDNIHPSASSDQGVLKNVGSLDFFFTLRPGILNQLSLVLTAKSQDP